MNLVKHTAILLFLLLSSIRVAFGDASPVSANVVISEPKRFDGKSITVIGLAEIAGSEFWLYPDAAQARKGGKAIFVERDLNKPLHQEMDGHWVRVSGILKAAGRGPLGVVVPKINLRTVRRVHNPTEAKN